MGNHFNIDAKFRGSNDVEMIINPAKVQQFGTSLTDLSELLALIKTLFYLDDVIGFKANYSGADYHGFWGLVSVGGDNEQFHKSSRIINVSIEQLSNSMKILNDAGLNTKARADAPHSQLEGTAVELLVYPAYYVAPTQVDLYYRRVDSGGTPISSYVLAGTQNVSDGSPIDYRNVSFGKEDYSLEVGNHEWYAVITNDEGNTTTASAVFEIAADSTKEQVVITIGTVSIGGGQTQVTVHSDTAIDGTLVVSVALSSLGSINISIENGNTEGVGYISSEPEESGTASITSLSGGNTVTQEYIIGTPSSVDYEGTTSGYAEKTYNGYDATSSSAAIAESVSGTGYFTLHRTGTTWYNADNSAAAAGYYALNGNLVLTI